jgi:hypothetical protein
MNLNIPARNKAYEIGARIMADHRALSSTTGQLVEVDLTPVKIGAPQRRRQRDGANQ